MVIWQDDSIVLKETCTKLQGTRIVCVSHVSPAVIVIITSYGELEEMRHIQVKVKQSRYRPGVAQRVPGS
jgi:hypothetical protein